MGPSHVDAEGRADASPARPTAGSGYWRSALLRYLEEALAESYAQLRVHGLQAAVVGIRFPVQHGYVTVSQIATEGVAIGNIAVGGSILTVRVSEGLWEAH